MIGTIAFWDLFLRGTAALVAVTLHGFVLVLLFRAMGDRGPQQDGRLTLNPMAHFPVPTLISAVLARVAWAQPLDINAGALRGGRIGVIVPVIGALAATLAFAWVAHSLRGAAVANLPPQVSQSLLGWLTTYSQLSVWMVLANLVPLPPLTAGYLWAGLSPRLWAAIAPRRGQIGLALVVLFSVAGYLGWLRPLAPIVAALSPG